MGERGGLVMIFMFIVSCLVSFPRCAHAYQNYTVGGSLGWFDSLEKPAIDYQKWAHSIISFSLGDFLIFNTDNNHSVVQTSNYTTFQLCDYEDDLSNEVVLWAVLNPSAVATDPVSVAVPLLTEGATYFFSGDYDGDQCKNGQRFSINVTRGKGLPESLREPSDESQSPGPVSAQAGNDDTIVPANFDHPKEDANDDKNSRTKLASGSISLVPIVELCAFLVFLGLLCTSS